MKQSAWCNTQDCTEADRRAGKNRIIHATIPDVDTPYATHQAATDVDDDSVGSTGAPGTPAADVAGAATAAAKAESTKAASAAPATATTGDGAGLGTGVDDDGECDM